MFGATIRCGIYEQGCLRNYEYIRCAEPEAYALKRIKDLSAYMTIGQHMSPDSKLDLYMKNKAKIAYDARLILLKWS